MQSYHECCIIYVALFSKRSELPNVFDVFWEARLEVHPQKPYLRVWKPVDLFEGNGADPYDYLRRKNIRGGSHGPEQFGLSGVWFRVSIRHHPAKAGPPRTGSAVQRVRHYGFHQGGGPGYG